MAIDDAELVEARTGFLKAIVPSMAAIFIVLLASLAAFIRFGLSPLNKVQTALADVRTGSDARP